MAVTESIRGIHGSRPVEKVSSWFQPKAPSLSNYVLVSDEGVRRLELGTTTPLPSSVEPASETLLKLTPAGELDLLLFGKNNDWFVSSRVNPKEGVSLKGVEVRDGRQVSSPMDHEQIWFDFVTSTLGGSGWRIEERPFSPEEQLSLKAFEASKKGRARIRGVLLGAREAASQGLDSIVSGTVAGLAATGVTVFGLAVAGTVFTTNLEQLGNPVAITFTPGAITAVMTGLYEGYRKLRLRSGSPEGD